MTLRRFVALAVATVLVQAGCTDRPPPAKAERKSKLGESCTRTADCEPGTRCVNLTCVAEKSAASKATPTKPVSPAMAKNTSSLVTIAVKGKKCLVCEIPFDVEVVLSSDCQAILDGRPFAGMIGLKGKPSAFKQPDALAFMDGLEKALSGTGGVVRTYSLARVVRWVNQQLQETESAVDLPRSFQQVAQILLLAEMAMGAEELEPLVGFDYRAGFVLLELSSGTPAAVKSVGMVIMQHTRAKLPKGMTVDRLKLSPCLDAFGDIRHLEKLAVRLKAKDGMLLFE